MNVTAANPAVSRPTDSHSAPRIQSNRTHAAAVDNAMFPPGQDDRQDCLPQGGR